MKTLVVIGNRPQFIKAAPLSVSLRGRGIDEVVVHTGQHYDRALSRVFVDELGLPEPRYSLGIGGLPRSEMLARMAPALGSVIREERPDWVAVLGDTNSTLAGARAAAAEGARLAHVEAGLRSGDLAMPEEHNRIEVDRAADLLLCPDERSRATLAAEGVRGRAEVVGDVMADVAFRVAPLARARSTILAELGLEPGRYVLATIHREANVDPRRLSRIARSLDRIADRVVLPAHPRTRRALADAGIALAGHVTVLEPLGYLDFAALAAQARVIATDSGGLQKEAYWYGVPCVTLRPSTEWVDTVDAGANVLVDDDPDRIAAAVAAAKMPAERPPLYGDGRAADRIAELLATLTPR